jgi:hypothetical protein
MTTPLQPSRSAVLITPTPLDDICNAGRNQRPKGNYQIGMFQGVKTTHNLAHVLGVPSAAIACVIPKKNTPCVNKGGCKFNAIEGNGNRCPAHQRSWYPLANERGCDLLGSDFMRASGKFRSCDCTSTFCSAAGYFPNQDAIYVPQQARDVMLGTPGLFSKDRKQLLETRKTKQLYLYPWHFFPTHLVKSKGKWELDYSAKDKDRKYKDLEGKVYGAPPPRNTARAFLDEQYFPTRGRPQDRWVSGGSSTDLPQWAIDLVAIDKNNMQSTPVDSTPADFETPIPLEPARRSERIAALPPPDLPTEQDTTNEPIQLLPRTSNQGIEYWKEKCSVMAKEIESLKMWQARAFQLQQENERIEKEGELRLAGAKRRYDDEILKTKQELENERKKTKELEAIIKELEEKLEEVRLLLEEARQQKGRRALRYSDFYDGGVLSKHVDAFSFFNTIEKNDAFLELMNYADGSEGSMPVGDGLLENLRPYSKVSRAERAGEVEPPSLNAEEYAKWLQRRNRARKEDALTYKDEYLAYCLYVRAGCTMEFIESLMRISDGTMSDIFHAWSNVLDALLCAMHPRPTRSQMYQAYPQRIIEADGHARCFGCCDGTEIFCQQSANNNVASATHSDYKGHNTIKFLVYCDPIGCIWGDCVPDGNPGKISDVVATEDTEILRKCCPFGSTTKTDKGFLVDNQAAEVGVINDRPTKRQKHQKQQSEAEVGNTQNKGNTRIVVENVNGSVKVQIRYLLGLARILQFGTISKVVRIGYLLQNFKRGMIQNNNYDTESSPVVGRPCRSEIRWYGAKDSGLRDVRDTPKLWGLQCEIDLHEQMSAMSEHKDKTPIQISEMILAQRHDLRLRKEMYRTVHGIEYTDDL